MSEDASWSRWNRHAHSASDAVVLQEQILLYGVLFTVLSKLVQSRWSANYVVLVCVVTYVDYFSFHIH